MFAGPVEITIPTSWFIYALVFFVAWISFAVWTARNRKGHPLVGFLLGFVTFPLSALALLAIYSSA
jgi:hypothetical protein